MKYIILVISILVFSQSCKTCIEGSGQEKTKTFQLDVFEKIEIDGSGKIILQQGNTQEVKLVADDNIIEFVNITVSRNRLKIKNTECFDSYGQLTVYVTIPNFKELTINGDADVSTAGLFTCDDFDCDLNGSGKVKLNMNCDDITTDINGTGRIIYEGQCDTHDVNLDGSGILETTKMIARDFDIDLKGTGSAKIQALDDLNIKIDGTGNVYYKGKPKNLNTQINGTGKVQAIE